MIEFFQKWFGILLIMTAIFILAHHYGKIILDWLRFQSLGTRDYIFEKLKIMFIDVEPQYILATQFVISFGFGLIVFLLILPQVLPAFLFGLIVTGIGWKAPKPIVTWLYKKRVEKFVIQMVDGLGLMSNGMKSGLSVNQAMEIIVQEMENPLAQEFELVLSKNRIGVPLEEALTEMSKRMESDDVEMFVTAINILKETGGNLAETFDTIVLTIRERIKVEKKIEALTAQGFYQGITVLCVPPAMGGIFYGMDPEFMQPLFTTTMGWFVVLAILVLEVVAFFVIMRVTRIDV